MPGNDLTAHIQPALAAHTRPPLATRKRTCRCRSSRAARASRRCVWRCTCARNPDAQERYLGSEYFVVSRIPWAPDTVSGRPNPKDGAVQAAVKPSTSYVHPRHQLRRQRVRLSETGTARSFSCPLFVSYGQSLAARRNDVTAHVYLSSERQRALRQALGFAQSRENAQQPDVDALYLRVRFGPRMSSGAEETLCILNSCGDYFLGTRTVSGRLDPGSQGRPCTEGTAPT